MKPQTGSAKPASASSGRNPKRWFLPAVFGVLLVLTGGVFYYLYRDEPPVQEDQTPRAVSLAPRTFLPAHGRVPRSKSQDPTRFSDPEVRSAYEVARSAPELLESMPCYCGCYSLSGHSSNYDCFVDDHGVTWALCRTIALEAQKQRKAGVPIAQIKRYIDERYAR